MAKDAIYQYDNTASNNTDVGGINLSEGVMVPSDLNNAIREVMSHLGDFADGTSGIDILSLVDDDASHAIKLQAPSAVTTTTTLTLPDGAGSANQVLTTNGSGTLSWSTPANFGSWTITMDGSNNLIFAYSGTDKMKLDSSGNLTVVGNVTAYGTI
jgi:hypothetical protein